MEDNNVSVPGSDLSGEQDPENSNKQNEKNFSAKKTVKKKAGKVAPEPEKAGDADTGAVKKTTKKAAAKKTPEVKADSAEPKPARAKKATAKPADEVTKDDAQKPIKRHPPARKKSLSPDDTSPVIRDEAAANAAAEEQQAAPESSAAIMPANEPAKPAETAPVADETATAVDTQVADVEEPDLATNAEPAAEEEKLPVAVQAENTAQTAGIGERTEDLQEPEVETIAKTEEEPQVQQSPATAEPALNSLPADSSSTTPLLQKITFRVKFYTHVGQSLYVTGNHSLLGNNNAEKAFPLSYLNAEHWSGSLAIPEDQPLTGEVSYHYILKDIDGTITPEWGEDKVIQPSKITTKEVLLADTWNTSSAIENTFYTEPFQQVLLKDTSTHIESKQPATVTHVFKAKTPLLAKGHTLCITGSIPELGEWNIINPILLLRKEGETSYTVSLDLPDATFPFTYKYGVFDTVANKFLGYEDGKDRVLDNNASAEKLTIVSDGFAVLPNTVFKGAGVAIPVFSLRSENSFGVGEFTDLKLLVDWAKQAGLKLIQLLPVNDTTATHSYTDSYPYAAISAFALHALYLHLPSLADNENKSLLDAFQQKQAALNNEPAVDYVNVMAAKWSFIKQIFPSQKQATFNNPDFKSFFDENNHWLIPYAAFSYLREKYNTPDFNQWPENQTFNSEKIKAIASSPLDDQDEVSMYYYVQYHLHLQLKDAANYAHENGIIVKGDIPIGIFRYSCDAWQQPQLFNMNMQAGAPPDDFAVKGQNWGFPTYNWQQMREDGFTWWKKRFTQMSYYFDAFRIDHILGFFRIWSISMDAVEGIMGHFVPAMPINITELFDRGILYDIKRFTDPYITGQVLTEIFEAEKETIITQFLQASTDGNYFLKPEFDTQRKVETHFSSLENNAQNNKIKSGLFDLISNVILFEAEGSAGREFHFRIAMDSTASFRYLDGHTQYLLRELYINYFYRRQDNFWMKEAMLKLPELKRSTNMLICGEDLGMVPDCVPGVMKELAILSLEIQRMPKDPKRNFFHPKDAPYLSVVTPSTHDMSTIRGWWEQDRAATQLFFNNELGQWGTAPYFCEPWINRIILMQHFYSPAMWSIFQLQDLLGISATLRRENPQEERINIPADPKHYWRYRMHLTLEQLMNESEFTNELKNYVVQSGR